MPAPEVRRVSKSNRRGSTAAVHPAAPGGEGIVTSGNVEIAPADVARLAHSYWEARGCQGGSPEEDWLRAEQQLRSGK